MIDIQDIYSTLLTATFGGVPFAVVDTSQETGRRVMRFLYPGIDDASFQDLGADDGPISIKGLLVGTDYLAKMRVMNAVWRSPGPYTLVHPWLGTMQVVFAQRPRMNLSATELGIARFEMQLYPFAPTAGAGLDTLSALELRLDALTADAQNWLVNAMAPAVNVLGAFGYVQNWLSQIAGVFNTVVQSTPSAGAIIAASTSAIASVADITTAPSAAWANVTAGVVAAVPAAIADACTPTVPSAVAPGGATAAAAAADPADTAATLLAAVPGIAGVSSANAPGPALNAAMQALLVGAAVQAASNINYTSQQQAQAQAAVLYAAIDAAAVTAASAAQGDPANAAPVWRDLVSLKSALSADLSALIGRLPPVVTIMVPRVMSAWTLAQYISGDDPGQVIATYQDIIARNAILNPALVQPGPLEVLNVA